MSVLRQPTKFRVGDRVKFDLFRRRLTGVIVEDMMGAKGRHVFQVQVEQDPDEPTFFALSEDEIEPAPDPTDEDTAMEQKQILAYLVNGGLTSILRSNLAGGKNQPRAWLRPDNLGNVTHTFVPERGIVGGEVVPSAATKFHKVVSTKRDQVLSFLRSFGLSHSEAEAVMHEVGTIPTRAKDGKAARTRIESRTQQ